MDLEWSSIILSNKEKPRKKSHLLECKGEAITQGSCAKMFTIAGPVIVYGVSTSVIYGIILVLLQSF